MASTKKKAKSEFRVWLDTQPRSSLSYCNNAQNPKGIGWRTEEFIREAWARGFDVRIPTVNKWISGARPRHLSVKSILEAFPEAKFLREAAR